MPGSNRVYFREWRRAGGIQREYRCAETLAERRIESISNVNRLFVRLSSLCVPSPQPCKKLLCRDFPDRPGQRVGHAVTVGKFADVAALIANDGLHGINGVARTPQPTGVRARKHRQIIQMI